MRANELDSRPSYLRRICKLARQQGGITFPEQMLSQFIARDPVRATTQDRDLLVRLRGWKSLYLHGFPLPQRRVDADYVGTPDRILYCLHFSFPHDNTGYSVRSHGVLRSVEAAGMSVVACTRLGFPWDRAARGKPDPQPDFAAEDTVEGIRYRRFRTLDSGWGHIPPNWHVQLYADQIKQFARAERPSIIHAASNWVDGIAAITAARTLRSTLDLRGSWIVGNNQGVARAAMGIKRRMPDDHAP